MRSRNLFTALIAGLLVLSAASAALATEQWVEVDVLEAGIISIDVEHQTGLGYVFPGQTTPERYFWMQVTNTVEGQGWQVSADGPDLMRFDGHDEFGAPNWVATDTIAKTHLKVSGGAAPHWDVVHVTYSEQSLGAAQPIMQGSAGAFGTFGIHDPEPYVKVDLTGLTEVAFGSYGTTITYTIQSVL